MWITKVAGNIIDRVVDRVQRSARDQEIADPLAYWAASNNDLKDLAHPSFYFDFVRQWVDDMHIDARELKSITDPTDHTAIRYCTLIDTLRSRIPVEPFSAAHTVAIAADRLLARRDPIEFDTWHADIGLHFFISSSLARKGRILQAVVRLMRPQRYLELGTAYGMSALFVGLAMKTIHDSWSIVTVELGASQHQVATGLLVSQFGDKAECHLANAQSTLTLLAKQSRSFDFLFHDAGHSYDDYVNDFLMAEPMLVPGAICLIDDIYWSDSRFHQSPPRCHEGWLEVVSHPRVRAAAELDHGIGILLLH